MLTRIGVIRPVAPARNETPLLHGVHRFLIQTERRLEASNNPDVTDRAIREDEGFDAHHALSAGHHACLCVVRPNLAE